MTRTTMAAVILLAATAVRAEQRAVRIGAAMPLTGPEAKSGVRMRDGYQFAVDLKMREGGLLIAGRRVPIALTVVDDHTDKETTVRETEKLIAGGVDFMLGTFSTSLVEVASTVAEKAKVPYVAGSGAATQLFQRNYKYLFGLQSPIDQLANALLRWIDEEQKAGRLPTPLRVGVVWENTSHGKDYRRGVTEFATKTAARRAAYQLVFDEMFELNAKEWKPLLSRIQAANIDVLLVDAHLTDYISMQKDYAKAGMCHKVLSYGARGPEPEALAALPKGAPDYILSAVWWDAQLGGKGISRDFVEAFRARTGRPPEWAEALGYEAARALFTAVEQAGTLDREKVREALANLRMESILPGGFLNFPAEYGQQAHYLFVVQQNMPDGTSPIIYPKIASTHAGVAPNPRCAGNSTAAR